MYESEAIINGQRKQVNVWMDKKTVSTIENGHVVIYRLEKCLGKQEGGTWTQGNMKCDVSILN